METSEIIPPDMEHDRSRYLLEQRFPNGFILDRPYGSKQTETLLLHFRNSAAVRIGDQESQATPSSCLFLTPGTGYRITTVAEKSLVFDGVYLPRELSPQAQALGLPVDRVFKPVRTDFIPFMVNAMRLEEEGGQPNAGEIILHTLSTLLLLLSRHTALAPDPGGKGKREELLLRFQLLREKVVNQPGQAWTVEGMAEQVHMSRSRFSSTFSEVFDEPPRDFLIHTRLRHAIVLITNTSLSMSEIAEESGFQSPYYFSRIFAKRIGCPPSKYAERFMIP
jgi:AraC-like DNA-binding protein